MLRDRRTTPVALPVIAVDADMSDALERRLRPIAEQARAGDTGARDALWFALWPKLQRMTWNMPAPRSGTWDHDDVAQEAWLAFEQLVRLWPGDRPFGRYVLATFRWRLRDRVTRGIGRPATPPRTLSVRIDDELQVRDDRGGEGFICAEIHALADTLPAFQGALLRRHILGGEPLIAVARDHGLAKRTSIRRWREVREQLA